MAVYKQVHRQVGNLLPFQCVKAKLVPLIARRPPPLPPDMNINAYVGKISVIALRICLGGRMSCQRVVEQIIAGILSNVESAFYSKGSQLPLTLGVDPRKPRGTVSSLLQTSLPGLVEGEG